MPDETQGTDRDCIVSSISCATKTTDQSPEDYPHVTSDLPFVLDNGPDDSDYEPCKKDRKQNRGRGPEEALTRWGIESFDEFFPNDAKMRRDRNNGIGAMLSRYLTELACKVPSLSRAQDLLREAIQYKWRNAKSKGSRHGLEQKDVRLVLACAALTQRVELTKNTHHCDLHQYPHASCPEPPVATKHLKPVPRFGPEDASTITSQPAGRKVNVDAVYRPVATF